LEDVFYSFADEGFGDVDFGLTVFLHLWGIETYVFEDAFDDGHKAAGADVFELAVGLGGEFGHGVEGGVVKIDGEAFGGDEGLLLFGEGGIGLGEDAAEVVFGEGIEFDADGKATLEFGHEVGDGAGVEGAGGNEEDLVGVHYALASIDGAAFDDGKEVALDALPRNIGSRFSVADGDFVYFVEEDHAGLLGAFDGFFDDFFGVEEFFGFFFHEDASGVGDSDAAAGVAVGDDVFEHIGHAGVHLLGAHHGDDGEGLFFADGDFDFGFIEVAGAEFFEHTGADSVVGGLFWFGCLFGMCFGFEGGGGRRRTLTPTLTHPRLRERGSSFPTHWFKTTIVTQQD